MNKEKAVTTSEATTVTGRKVPAIEPRDQKGDYFQSAGQAWRVLYIVAPEGLQPSDLHEHPREVFGKLQATGLGQLKIIPLDELHVIAKDKSWLVEGRVLGLDKDGVPAFKPRTVSYLPVAPAAPPAPTSSERKVEMTAVRG